jgi:SAM-dependent methyltransferase
MPGRRVERLGVREGYDRWAQTYDATPNPVVSLDRRYTLLALDARPGEVVLDAGCGTGAHLGRLCNLGARVLGLDVSLGMLRVARYNAPVAALARADLNESFPVPAGGFDAVLSSLVSEHLTNLNCFFGEAFAALREGGRFVFSAFHPEPARAGVEANFERYRLGAQAYTVEEYLGRMADAGFERLTWHEFRGDDRLRDEMPHAAKYVGRPLLLLACAERAA